MQCVLYCKMTQYLQGLITAQLLEWNPRSMQIHIPTFSFQNKGATAIFLFPFASLSFIPSCSLPGAISPFPFSLPKHIFFLSYSIPTYSCTLMLHPTPRIPSSTSTSQIARPGVFPSQTTTSRQHQQQKQTQHRTYISAYSSSQSTKTNGGLTTPTLTASTSTTSTSTSTSATPALRTVSRMGSTGTENVKVAVRCRPLSQKESFTKSENAWDIDTSLARIRATDAALLSRRPLQQPPSTEFHFGKPNLADP